MPEKRTHYSIIIPVYNGAEHLEACLTALVNQDYPRDLYEILVVNDGSTDGSPEIAARFPVRLVHLPSNQGRIAARNAGAEAAAQDTLVFNDVRVVPEREYLKKADIRNYQPLMPGSKRKGSRGGGFRAFFIYSGAVFTILTIPSTDRLLRSLSVTRTLTPSPRVLDASSAAATCGFNASRSRRIKR